MKSSNFKRLYELLYDIVIDMIPDVIDRVKVIEGSRALWEGSVLEVDDYKLTDLNIDNIFLLFENFALELILIDSLNRDGVEGYSINEDILNNMYEMFISYQQTKPDYKQKMLSTVNACMDKLDDAGLYNKTGHSESYIMNYLGGLLCVQFVMKHMYGSDCHPYMASIVIHRTDREVLLNVYNNFAELNDERAK